MIWDTIFLSLEKVLAANIAPYTSAGMEAFGERVVFPYGDVPLFIPIGGVEQMVALALFNSSITGSLLRKHTADLHILLCDF